MAEGAGLESSAEGYAPHPRIRHITGIRIHQLTLPESLALASKLVPSTSVTEESPDHDILGEPSRRSRSPDTGLVSSRRLSSASARVHLRDGEAGIPNSPKLHRSISSTRTITTLRRERVGRGRAPTLAGEALEALEGGVSALHAPRLSMDIEEEAEEEEIQTRRLARCFVVLKMPEQSRSTSPLDPSTGHRGSIPSPRWNDGLHGVHERAVSSPDKSKHRLERQSSSGSLSGPSTPLKAATRPPFSQSSSRTSISTSSAARTRTTSLPSTRDSAPTPNGKPSLSRSTSRMSTATESSARLRVRSGGLGHPPWSPSAKATLAPPRVVSHGRPDSPPTAVASIEESRNSSPTPTPVPPGTPAPEIPFVVSSIHRPSTHPRWLNLSPESDFAPWLPDFWASDCVFELQIWYEDTVDVWKQLDGVPKMVDLRDLRRLEKGADLPDNTLQMDFSNDPRATWYLPRPDPAGATSEGAAESTSPKAQKTTTVRGIVERSIRETRMKKGVAIGSLQQLVNTQAVIVDTQRGIAELQRKIDKLLFHDVGARGLKRDVGEREDRILWMKSKVMEVEANTKETEAKVTLQRRAIEERRLRAMKAREKDALLQGAISEVAREVDDAIGERLLLMNRIHYHRALHAQTLDFIFPITSISPSHLLYSILGVPLPIPIGPKDPAPPLTMPASALPENVKIDERIISAALGYVAMAVYLLGGLSGSISSLPYPITCFGSKSLVKDVVSLMQGPRSFPLYARGVEAYRYEYAVFLLNKNIESLMHDNAIRLLDLRHTLPNLKSLLLTLSSPVPPAASSLFGIASGGSSTYIGTSRTSSRQTSAAWPMAPSTPGDVSPVVTPSSPASTNRGFAGSVNTPSPLARLAKDAARGAGVRRSQLGKVARSPGNTDVALNSETEDETDSVISDREERPRRDSVREKYERNMPAQIPRRKAR